MKVPTESENKVASKDCMKVIPTRRTAATHHTIRGRGGRGDRRIGPGKVEATSPKTKLGQDMNLQ